ncbi:MAG: hypothetical protein CMM01_23610 [Rhodopirellula sp.]|nr:hypothetical protein [Rhodopirellula sp.]OUX49254.1 MAG: hypothetical protein CBE43_10520 [Rhodopirellula sp. TMED283]
MFSVTRSAFQLDEGACGDTLRSENESALFLSLRNSVVNHVVCVAWIAVLLISFESHLLYRLLAYLGSPSLRPSDFGRLLHVTMLKMLCSSGIRRFRNQLVNS